MTDEFLPYRPAIVSTSQRHEYQALKRTWDSAVNAHLANSDGPLWEQFDAQEETAYNSLADWVDENGLQWTKYDPRGPELVDPHATPTERQS